ncbi:MAG: hypothetical protein E7016_01795 [Alphaproteobacteria bacterium]|nr:hypothetical protein [Alphaproteobacteria bacterium]
MKKIINRVVAATAAILGLGIIAVKTAPQNTRPLGEKPPPQTAIIVKDEAMEELEKANRLNNQPQKH